MPADSVFCIHHIENIISHIFSDVLDFWAATQQVGKMYLLALSRLCMCLSTNEEITLKTVIKVWMHLCISSIMH
jgi:hypothetical protein